LTIPDISLAGQQFDYVFDDIENRKSTGGRAASVSTYTRNYLNQYSSRTVAGVVDIAGVANLTASVTVSDGTSTYTANRKREHFHYPFAVANKSAALPNLTAKSMYGATETFTGKSGRTAGDYSYEGIGSSDLTNWARAIMVLHRFDETLFELKFPKRGRRAGASDSMGSPTTSVWLKHADHGICWVQVDARSEEEKEQARASKTKYRTKPSVAADFD
jgi:hypothetical protein